ncbi:MAG: redox-sensing transcriptional repressor Rex [Phycisphaerae bacterium]|nr:redox-sensing transcriptional repressor Rex [Phycisphaerae bacterium]
MKKTARSRIIGKSRSVRPPIVRSRRTRCLLTHTVLERLMHYYICLSKYDPNIEWISSPHLAVQFRVDDTQVRKDLAVIGVKGRPNAGFRRSQILERIREFLGLGRSLKAVVVGVGRLGGALVAYRDFRELGLEIAGLFDNDPRKIGGSIAGLTILSTDGMKSFIRQRKIRIAILACPVFVAQILAHELVEAGIRAIWNFSPTTLQVPSGVFVRNEHISVGIGEIAYHLLPF